MPFNIISGSTLCCQCSGLIDCAEEACQALGMIFHNNCFVCCCCFRQLKGKLFYKDHGKLYCEEDYLYCGFQQNVDRCKTCGHMINNKVIKAAGNSFHVDCFRCHVCLESLEGSPFTVDKEGKIICIKDYYLLYSSLCANCSQPIVPEKDNLSIKRIVTLDKEYHVECFECQECQMNLVNEYDSVCYQKYDSVGKTTILCRRCNSKTSPFRSSVASSSSSSSLTSATQKRSQSSLRFPASLK